jgi:hypothetical protein
VLLLAPGDVQYSGSDAIVQLHSGPSVRDEGEPKRQGSVQSCNSFERDILQPLSMGCTCADDHILPTVRLTLLSLHIAGVWFWKVGTLSQPVFRIHLEGRINSHRSSVVYFRPIRPGSGTGPRGCSRPPWPAGPLRSKISGRPPAWCADSISVLDMSPSVHDYYSMSPHLTHGKIPQESGVRTRWP